jgi:hypothetical protein
MLVLLGIGFMVLGVIVTIALVAGESGCNAATTNIGSDMGSVASGSFCGHSHGFLTISFMIVVLGAVLIGLGGMVLPTLRTRDARRAGQSSPPPAPPSAAD